MSAVRHQRADERAPKDSVKAWTCTVRERGSPGRIAHRQNVTWLVLSKGLSV